MYSNPEGVEQKLPGSKRRAEKEKIIKQLKASR
jgi:hypothetical protein